MVRPAAAGPRRPPGGVPARIRPVLHEFRAGRRRGRAGDRGFVRGHRDGDQHRRPRRSPRGPTVRPPGRRRPRLPDPGAARLRPGRAGAGGVGAGSPCPPRSARCNGGRTRVSSRPRPPLSSRPPGMPATPRPSPPPTRWCSSVLGMGNLLPRAASGMSSGAVGALLDRLAAEPVECHSIVVVRRGHIVAEGWWAPYSADRPHLLYSLTKSFTSIAVGLAIADGRLSLDDRVADVLPDHVPPGISAQGRRITVHHLLSMTAGHRTDSLAEAWQVEPGDLVKGFLRVPPSYPEGTRHTYDNATHLPAGPDGRAGDRPEPARAARRAPVRADGHRARRVGPGGRRRRFRLPWAAPHHRGGRRVRRAAAVRWPLGATGSSSRASGCSSPPAGTSAPTRPPTRRRTPISCAATATSSGSPGTGTTATVRTASSAWWSRRTISWWP